MASLEEDFIGFTDELNHEAKPIALMTENTAPWLCNNKMLHSNNPKSLGPISLIQLHNEILSFCDFVTPSKEEMQTRNSLLNHLRCLIKKSFPTASVHVFGSQYTEILTPTSDLDIAILDVPGDSVDALYVLQEAIYNENIATYLEVIANAKVPIVKFDHRESGISVDICVNNDSGLRTGKIMREFVREYPPLKPLTVVLKVFLSQRRLHETYTGGIGSFVLSIMVVSLLQQRLRMARFRNMNKLTWNLGSLLLEFFNFYGISFNYVDVGITVRNGGSYFPKRGKGNSNIWVNPSRSLLLAIENPDLPDTDIGRNSYMLPKIKRAFEHAFQLLTAAFNNQKSKTDSLLSFVIRTNDPIFTSRSLTFNTNSDLNKKRKSSARDDKDYSNSQNQSQNESHKNHSKLTVDMTIGNSDSDSDSEESGEIQHKKRKKDTKISKQNSSNKKSSDSDYKSSNKDNRRIKTSSSSGGSGSSGRKVFYVD